MLKQIFMSDNVCSYSAKLNITQLANKKKVSKHKINRMASPASTDTNSIEKLWSRGSAKKILRGVYKNGNNIKLDILS